MSDFLLECTERAKIDISLIEDSIKKFITKNMLNELYETINVKVDRFELNQL